MMQIAIVDDLAADRAGLQVQLAEELAARHLSSGIREFSSGEAFLSAFSPGLFSIVFLDIFMDGISGMDVARQLYAKDPGCKIIFLSTSQDYLLESYAVRATYYLLKPIDSRRLHQALDFCFPPESAADTLPVRVKGGTVIVPRRDICYIESVERVRLVHLVDRVISTPEAFGELTAPLADDPRFLPCGRGVLLHMAFISAQDRNDFVMSDGTRLPIPRRTKNEILQTFQAFALRSMEVSP